jgi:hypothetical protein
MTTTPYIPKVQVDGIDLFIDSNSLSVKTGLPNYNQFVQVNGSQRKVTNVPDYTNAFGTVSFGIRMNANAGLTNPLLFFKSLKTRHDIKITVPPEEGFGTLVYNSMTLLNDIDTTVGSDAVISFQFSGEPANILEN